MGIGWFLHGTHAHTAKPQFCFTDTLKGFPPEFLQLFMMGTPSPRAVHVILTYGILAALLLSSLLLSLLPLCCCAAESCSTFTTSCSSTAAAAFA
jgi:hypothetical protein